jgi:type II secretory pathway pseudopilin PulG
MTANPGRRGITLLEVLISIGILAIGLSSVVALIPAAASQASRAVILDRAAVLAANALSDAATFGLLRPDALTVPLGPTQTVLIDPDVAGYCCFKTGVNAAVNGYGVYGSTGRSSKAPDAYARLICQSRDDIVVRPGVGPDDPPVNAFDDDGDVRSFEGRLSCLLFLQTDPVHKVTVVVFHARDVTVPAQTALDGTLANGELTLTSSLPPGRRIGDVIKPGVVVAVLKDGTDPRAFVQVVAATRASDTSAYVTLADGGLYTLETGPVTVLVDSVGVAQRVFTPEPAGAFTP